jgi:N-methylhydantoinase A
VRLYEETGAIAITKVSSTPDDPSQAILEGIGAHAAGGVRPYQLGFFCHGTTVGTNALLEGKGARTALLVTAGFRGIYEVREQARPYGAAIFDVMYDRPAMLVPPSRTGEVRERIDFRGEVIEPIDEEGLRKTLRQLAAQGIESVAVCLLFSFLNRSHEDHVAALAAEEMPACGVSLSSDVVPQIREYYRLSTTVINAYLQPMLARYIARLDSRLAAAGIATARKYIMQSNGGTATFAAAAQRAVTTVLSGPAGGVTAGIAAGRALGVGNLITFDMGGTSCDVALIRNGEDVVANWAQLEAHGSNAPMRDHNTARWWRHHAGVDRIGALQVGPQSAGAVPGPACYGRGGDLPTVTDCNLALGYLSADNFLGGRMRLDPDRARQAIGDKVARPLGLPIETAAEGVVRIIEVKMEEAIKAISTMRGHDLREFMLLAFGGAGPVHNGRIARDLGLAGVIVPPYPGVFSAIGLLISDVKHDYVQSRLTPIAALTVEAVEAVFDRLEREAVAQLQRDGFSPAAIRLDRTLDMRYSGQGYETAVPCPAAMMREGGLVAIRKRFDEQHRAMFGHMAPGEPVEVVSYRLRGNGIVAPPPMPKFKPAGTPLSEALREYREVVFDGRRRRCPVYQRERVDVGATLAGPAILDQFDCTTVVSPGQTARVDQWKNLLIKEAP